MRGHHLTIAQFSDIHCGHVMFDADLMESAIDEIVQLQPDLVVMAGDLTSEGYAPQFRQAKRYLDRLGDLEMVVIPGNHDLMNVGFLHFRDAFGKSDRVMRIPFSTDDGQPQRYATVVAVNSSKPDLADGEIGHIRYDWIRQSYEWPDDYRIFVLHHHLVSVPGTGRERSTVMDAGDLLEVLVGKLSDRLDVEFELHRSMHLLRRVAGSGQGMGLAAGLAVVGLARREPC